MKIKQICSKLLSLKKSDYIVFALMGILILIVAIPTGGAEKKEKNDSEIAYEDQSRSENENYGKELEKQLKDILEKIEGIQPVSPKLLSPESLYYEFLKREE